MEKNKQQSVNERRVPMDEQAISVRDFDKFLSDLDQGDRKIANRQRKPRLRKEPGCPALRGHSTRELIALAERHSKLREKAVLELERRACEKDERARGFFIKQNVKPLLDSLKREPLRKKDDRLERMPKQQLERELQSAADPSYRQQVCEEIERRNNPPGSRLLFEGAALVAIKKSNEKRNRALWLGREADICIEELKIIQRLSKSRTWTEEELRKHLPSRQLWKVIDQSEVLSMHDRREFFVKPLLCELDTDDLLAFVSKALGVPKGTLGDYRKKYRKESGQAHKRGPKTSPPSLRNKPTKTG